MESSWLGFWLFLIAMVLADAYLYGQGHDSFFFKHKTPEELRIREAQIRKLEIEAGIRDESGQLRKENE